MNAARIHCTKFTWTEYSDIISHVILEETVRLCLLFLWPIFQRQSLHYEIERAALHLSHYKSEEPA